MSRSRTIPAFVLCGLALALGGCGGRPKEPYPRQPTYPVEGRLLVRGRPAEAAQLTFNPVGVSGWQGPFPTADTAADGTFTVRTYGVADGAPAGKYAVTVVWPVPGEKEERPDRLGARYATAATTSIWVEVLPQANRLRPIAIP